MKRKRLYLSQQQQTTNILTMKTIFTYTTAKGNNVETFQGCDITLKRNGLHVYQQWVSSLMMPLYIHQLEQELVKRGVEYTKEEI